MKNDVAEILGVPVEDYDTAFSQLEVRGGFDSAKVHKLLILICKKIESLENAQPIIQETVKEVISDKVSIYNPETEDFECVMRDEKDNKPLPPFIVPAKDIATFEPKVAKHVQQQLIGWVISRRGIKENLEVDKSKVDQETTVKV